MRRPRRSGLIAALAAALFLPPAPAGAQPSQPPPDVKTDIVKERDDLLMLAAEAFVYSVPADKPAAGYDIAAAIAWGVDDVDRTPDFVIDRNRNYAEQDDNHHAKADAIHLAYQAMFNIDLPYAAAKDTRYDSYPDSLSGATLYTTLESCPMCATRITMARISRAVFCVMDPGLRDLQTQEPTVKTPTKFLGGSMRSELISEPNCGRAGKLVWQAATAAPGAAFSLTSFLRAQRDAIFKPAYDALLSYAVKYPSKNQELLQRLQDAVKTPSLEAAVSTPASRRTPRRTYQDILSEYMREEALDARRGN